MNQEPKLNLQIFQGSGFQKGAVFHADGKPSMERPNPGFMAGAVYGVDTKSAMLGQNPQAK